MANCNKSCGNCAHSVLHIPITDKENQHMVCLNWSMVVLSTENCNEFKNQLKVNYFHTWNEKTQRPNTIFYQLKDLEL